MASKFKTVEFIRIIMGLVGFCRPADSMEQACLISKWSLPEVSMNTTCSESLSWYFCKISGWMKKCSNPTEVVVVFSKSNAIVQVSSQVLNSFKLMALINNRLKKMFDINISFRIILLMIFRKIFTPRKKVTWAQEQVGSANQ